MRYRRVECVTCCGPGDDWCALDTGQTTITDGHGNPHSVYVSVTRDGSVWLRAGRDHASLDWTYVDERRTRFQSVLLDAQTVALLEALNYTDHCVLTDLTLSVTVDSGWHPSHISVFEPRTKHSKVLSIKHYRDCLMSTVLAFSRDKQAITCQGGPRNACRKRTLPPEALSTDFLKVVNFDPQGLDHWQCREDEELNSYTFLGSYYHAYVKLATCPAPAGEL